MIQISPFHHLFKAVPECKDGYEKLGSSTMCLVDSDDVISAGVSEEDKWIILQEHNRYRAMVDPPASNMMKIVRSISIYVCLFKNLWKMLRSDQIWAAQLFVWYKSIYPITPFLTVTQKRLTHWAVVSAAHNCRGFATYFLNLRDLFPINK